MASDLDGPPPMLVRAASPIGEGLRARTRRRVVVKTALQSPQSEELVSGTHCSSPTMARPASAEPTMACTGPVAHKVFDASSTTFSCVDTGSPALAVHVATVRAARLGGVLSGRRGACGARIVL